MSRAGAVLALAVALFLASLGRMAVMAQERERTVWDGVYTEAQAARATPMFSQSCSGCHSLTAEGQGPLAGEDFWEGYAQRTVGDLLSYVGENMPNGSGGSLPQSTYNDIVALILKSNGFPAGSTELTPAAVAAVHIVPKDGPGELPANTLVRVVGCLERRGAEWVLTKATPPVRIDTPGATPDDAALPLGSREIALKFVLTSLDRFAGHRMSVSGLLMGAGGADGLNVAAVDSVAPACP